MQESSTLIYAPNHFIQPQEVDFNHQMPTPQYNSYGIQVNQGFEAYNQMAFGHQQSQFYPQPLQTQFGAMPLPSHMRNPNSPQPLMALIQQCNNLHEISINIQTSTKGAVPLSQISQMIQQQKLMPQPGSHRGKKVGESEEATRKKGKKANTATTESPTPKTDRKTKQPNNGGNSNLRDKTSNKNLYLKYKTAICRHYELNGTCQLGKMCNFAHGSEEKRNMNDPLPKTFPGKQYIGVLHSNYKTQYCNNFKTQGHCKFGINCCFAHGDHELRQLTDPMPIVPPAVLYYGPPNMKVNPADIKVMTQSEEEMYAEQYPYYENYYDDMERQFIDQYQEMFDQQSPLQHQPTVRQEQGKYPPSSRQFCSQSQEAFPELQIAKPESQPVVKKAQKERKTKVVRQDQIQQSDTLPPTHDSQSSGLAEQALLDEAKNSHQDVQLSTSDEAVGDNQGPAETAISTNVEQPAKDDREPQASPQNSESKEESHQPEEIMHPPESNQALDLDKNSGAEDCSDHTLGDDEDHQMPDEVFEYTGSSRGHQSRFVTEGFEDQSQQITVQAMPAEELKNDSATRKSGLNVSLPTLPLHKVMPTQTGQTPVSSHRADFIDDDSPTSMALPKHEAITMNASSFTATGESGLSPTKLKRQI